MRYRVFAQLLIVLLGSSLLFSCKQEMTQKLFRQGTWRAVLFTDSGKQIPFNFEVRKQEESVAEVYLINGDERILVDQVSIGADTVSWILPVFDSEIKAIFEGNRLKGYWIKHYADKDVQMPFVAESDQDFRFSEKAKISDRKIEGTWEASFVDKEGTKSQAIGIFQQEQGKVTGTFRTPSGDYRFLQGELMGDTLKLSCFDGAHAFLFTALVKDDNTLVDGHFYSGASSEESWTAVRNEQASLPDVNQLTHLKVGYSTVSFSFPDLEKKQVSLQDSNLKDKVIVLQLMGTWCPNCMDETAYFRDFYNRYQSKGVEIIGLAFERSPDFEKARTRVKALKDRMLIEYPLVIAGTQAKPLEALPMLDTLQGFPTTIILDRKGQVRRIHTGFDGPATGDHYTEFVTEFEHFISELLNEKK